MLLQTSQNSIIGIPLQMIEIERTMTKAFKHVFQKQQNKPRGKSLLKIAYMIFAIWKSHDFFSVIFCDFNDFL